MKIRSTNLAIPKKVMWRGKEISTGIFKTPVEGPIYLGVETVAKDVIADRRVHGGVDKACYLLSSDQYTYWKALYPELEWNWGMFGENLTVDGLDEDSIYIGNIYEIGSALVQVSQPREPCYKLGIRFGSQKILLQFISHAQPGTYVRVLREGAVSPGDNLKLVEASSNALTVRDFFSLIFSPVKDQQLLQMAIDNNALPANKRAGLKKFME
ncbi:MAG: MOSC domain-containing protein [Flavobacteriaceae bacterium]